MMLAAPPDNSDDGVPFVRFCTPDGTLVVGFDDTGITIGPDFAGKPEEVFVRVKSCMKSVYYNLEKRLIEAEAELAKFKRHMH